VVAALSDRKAAQRQRDKAGGFVRLELRIEGAELALLDELCAALRPGKAAYTRPELVALAIRKISNDYRRKLAKNQTCKKCGEAAPVVECICAGDSECWLNWARRNLQMNI